MTRKRGVPSWKWQVRYHPYIACLRVHAPRPIGGLEAERCAAAQISGNDFFSRSLFRNDYNMEYRFRTPEQAHAMHIQLSEGVGAEPLEFVLCETTVRSTCSYVIHDPVTSILA